MKIRPIKAGHVVNCTWCKAMGNRVQALWHLTDVNKQACTQHRPQLELIKRQHEVMGKQEPSEADHQTWLKL